MDIKIHDATPQVRDWFCTVCGEKPSCKCQPKKECEEKCPHGQAIVKTPWCIECQRAYNQPPAEEKRRCDPKCIYEDCPRHGKSSPEAKEVEEKIKLLTFEIEKGEYNCGGKIKGQPEFFEKRLRDLVELARKSK